MIETGVGPASVASRVRAAEKRLRRLLGDPIPLLPEPLRFRRANRVA